MGLGDRAADFRLLIRDRARQFTDAAQLASALASLGRPTPGSRGPLPGVHQLAVRVQRWSGVPLSVHCRTWAPEAVLSFCTPSSSPLV